MDETLAFYRTLGFRMTGCAPDRDDPTWVELGRDDVSLWFSTEAAVGQPDEPVCSGTHYLFPDSVSALADELGGKVEFAWGPEIMPYGMLELGIQDPNGYFIAFTEPA